MTPFRRAIPAGLFLLSLSVVSPAQANDDTKPTFATHMQAPGQAPATGAPDSTSKLTAEELADLMMARKSFAKPRSLTRSLWISTQPARRFPISWELPYTRNMT
jgi:hypothetical protein